MREDDRREGSAGGKDGRDKVGRREGRSGQIKRRDGEGTTNESRHEQRGRLGGVVVEYIGGK